MHQLRNSQLNNNQIDRNIRLFYVRYSDALYVKLEKIEALALITTPNTSSDVIRELSEYCHDVQPRFVRASLRAIGRIACRVPEAADIAVSAYMKLLEAEGGNKLPAYAAQELLASAKDVYRTYPDRYEGTIDTLCSALTSYDDPAAKASLVWVLGEYCERVEGADEILAELLEVEYDEEKQSYDAARLIEETSQVQFAALTAAARMAATQQATEKVKSLFKSFHQAL